MDVETADQLWRHFTDVDGAAKRGHVCIRSYLPSCTLSQHNCLHPLPCSLSSIECSFIVILVDSKACGVLLARPSASALTISE